MKSTTYKHNPGPNKSKKKLVIACALLALALITAGGIIYSRRLTQESLRTEQKQKDEAQTKSSKKDIQTKDVDKGNDNDSKDNALPGNSTAKTPDQIPTSEALAISIKSTSQKDGTVSAIAAITGSTTEGTCVFTYTTPNERPVVQQVTSSDHTCSSNISEVKFSKLGTWSLSVIFYLNNAKTEVMQDVTIT